MNFWTFLRRMDDLTLTNISRKSNMIIMTKEWVSMFVDLYQWSLKQLDVHDLKDSRFTLKNSNTKKHKFNSQLSMILVPLHLMVLARFPSFLHENIPMTMSYIQSFPNTWHMLHESHS